jgi:hypothetical protein
VIVKILSIFKNDDCEQPTVGIVEERVEEKLDYRCFLNTAVTLDCVDVDVTQQSTVYSRVFQFRSNGIRTSYCCLRLRQSTSYNGVKFRPPTKFKRQGYSTHFEAAGHVGDKEGVRNDGNFFLNSKLRCLFRFTKNYLIII